MYMFLMRDEKEDRKKPERSKQGQTNKAKQHSTGYMYEPCFLPTVDLITQTSLYNINTCHTTLIRREMKPFPFSEVALKVVSRYFGRRWKI